MKIGQGTRSNPFGYNESRIVFLISAESLEAQLTEEPTDSAL